MKVVKGVGGEMHSIFFAAHKNVNRNPIKRRCVFIELLDGKHKEQDYEHIKNHDGVWVEKEKVEKFLSVSEAKVYWNIFQNKDQALEIYKLCQELRQMKAESQCHIAINSDRIKALKLRQK